MTKIFVRTYKGEILIKTKIIKKKKKHRFIVSRTLFGCRENDKKRNRKVFSAIK